MGALNSKPPAPFLTYLTVFKSRLGVVNVVLPLTSFAFQPAQTLARRLRQKLSELEEVDVNNPETAQVLQYLVAKRLVTAGTHKKRRYGDFSLASRPNGTWAAHSRAGDALSHVAVYRTDVWLADPNVESTIGVPTPENTEEVLELCFQLNLLSKAKTTWTAAGQVVHGLRESTPSACANPMRLGLEVAALLRQVIDTDGLLLRELLREIRSRSGNIRRDSLALALDTMAERAVRTAEAVRLPPPIVAEGKKFVALVKRTAAKREAASRAPGVLEHRMSPRLEWLVDFGALTKQGLPRNSFEYGVASDCGLLARLLEDAPGRNLWADDVALSYWRDSEHWRTLRGSLPAVDIQTALLRGYRVMKRSVGPTPIREVCFVAGVLAPAHSRGMGELWALLLELAAKAPGITVSGGRYSRTPELVHMADAVLHEG